ncbi:MAG: hypothetical protein Q9218_004580 [Villophora microphyllina]
MILKNFRCTKLRLAITANICLIAGILYLVLYFRHYARLRDIHSILATWGTLDHPSDSQAQRELADFTHSITPIPCHSHNDGQRQIPLYDALSIGCISIEADIWLQDGDLLVGHSQNRLTPSRTLQSLYLQPLISILTNQNHLLNLSATKASIEPIFGIYTTNPAVSLVLLIDIKSNGIGTLQVLNDQLTPLRDSGLLSYFNGTSIVQRPITIVASGNAPFSVIKSSNATTPRDIFYDAPLDDLWGETLPTNTTLYSPSNSVYASSSFASTIGLTWLGQLSPSQIYKIRGQIKGAHDRGLKVRYWATPSWPKSLRNHVWDILLKEGVDVLKVDDLKGARDFM